MKRILSLLAALVVGASVVFIGSVAADAQQLDPVTVETAAAPIVSEIEPPVADLVPLTPSRILDTRIGRGVASSGRVGPGASIDLEVLGLGGVPAAGVAGVVFNLTATAATERTFVNAWPSGTAEPITSVLNIQAGEVFANLVVADLGEDGRVSLSNAFGEVHLLADVVGWISTESKLGTLTPARLLDTRTGVGASAAGPVGVGGRVDLDVLGRGGVPSSGVDAVFVNVTATAATERSFVTVWPTGGARPTASALNMADAAPVPNLVLAKVGDGGQISVFNRAGSAHLIVDVVGYTAAGSDVVSLAPKRLLDTRSGVGVEAGRVGRGEFIDVTVVGVAGVPERGATAAIINVTAASPSERSFVTTWPTGLPQPQASSLNMLAGENVANLVVAPIGAGGKVRLFNAKGSTSLIADVVGYVGVPDGSTVPMVADEARVVSDEQLLSVDGDPDADDEVTMRLSADADVKVGSIVVVGPTDDTPSGLLRRIVSTERAADGSIVAVGERATISDAIPEGSFVVNTTFDPTAAGVSTQRVGVSAMAQGTSVEDHPFQCGSGVSLTGSVDASADPSLSMQFDWDTSGVNSAQLTAGLDVVFDFTASATAELGCSLTDSIFSVALPYIYVVVGGLPVVFVPTFDVELGVSANIKASINGNAQYRADVTAGVVYDQTTGLSTVGAVTPSMTGSWNVGASASAALSLTPSISLLAYGLGGPKAGVTFGVGIEADPCRTPLWKATSSITSSIALTVGIPWLASVDLGKADAVLNQSDLAEGGTAIPDFPGCDASVVVIDRFVGARVRVNARFYEERYDDSVDREPPDDDNPYTEVDDERQLKHEVGIQGTPAGDEGFTQLTTTGEDRPPYAPIGPFSNDANVAAAGEVDVEGASANGAGRGTVTISETPDEWSVTIDVAADVSANSRADVDIEYPNEDQLVQRYDADADARGAGGVRFELSGSAEATVVLPCGVPGLRWHFFRREGQTNEDIVASESCGKVVSLRPGEYYLNAIVEVSSDGTAGATGFLSLTVQTS